jgi:hypothetical protein
VWTGETIFWGGEEKLIYRELKPDFMRSEQRIMFGPNGQAMFHPAPPGAERIPMRHRVETIPEEVEGEPNPEAYREYVIEDSGHGCGKKIFNFREDPEVVERRAQEAAREAKAKALMDALLESDLEPEDILRRAQKPAETVEEKTEEVVQTRRMVHKGRGKWNVWEDDVLVGEKLTREAAEELVAETAP